MYDKGCIFVHQVVYLYVETCLVTKNFYLRLITYQILTVPSSNRHTGKLSEQQNIFGHDENMLEITFRLQN